MDPTRKARYVSVQHLTDTPFYMTYAILVGCYSVLLVLLMAALNYLDILAGGTHNAYLNAPTKEKLVFYAVDEWEYYQRKVVIIVRDIYGLKYSDLA